MVGTFFEQRQWIDIGTQESNDPYCFQVSKFITRLLLNSQKVYREADGSVHYDQVIVLTHSCDKRLARLISYIHHASEYRQFCCVGNTAQRCRLGLFQDSDFAGDLEDSKSTSGGTLCIFGSHTFVPISWMCQKQTSVSHSSTEAEVISLDAGLRMDGIPAVTLWDLVIDMLHSIPNRTDGLKREPRGNPSADVQPNMHNPIPIKDTNVIPTNIDHI